MTFTELPQRWSVLIDGAKHNLTLKQIFDLRAACDNVLERRTRTVEQAVNLVCAKFAMEREQLYSTTRTDRLCIARFCAWKMLYDRGMRVAEIARQFHKDQSTIKYGILSLKTRIETCPNAKEELQWVNGKASNGAAK